VGRSNDVVLMMTTYIDGTGPEVLKAKKELVRYLSLGFALLNMAARGEETAEDFDELCSRKDASGPLLMKGSAEYKALLACTGARYNVAYGWFMKRLNQLRSKGDLPYMPDTAMYMINIDISLMRGAGLTLPPTQPRLPAACVFHACLRAWPESASSLPPSLSRSPSLAPCSSGCDDVQKHAHTHGIHPPPRGILTPI